MPRGKDGAAVLVRKNRGFKRSVAASLYDYLVLIKSDAGAEYGNIDYRIGNSDRRKGLRCNLTETLSRDKRTALILSRAPLGKTHHKDTEKKGEVVLLAFISDLFLNVSEGDHVDVNL